MAELLASAVKGGRWPPQLITWEREDGVLANLTGAAMTGRIRNRATGETRAIAGTLTVVDGAAGQFLWSYAVEDVADSGEFDVQFTAEFAAGPTPGLTYMTRWDVKGSLG